MGQTSEVFQPPRHHEPSASPNAAIAASGDVVQDANPSPTLSVNTGELQRGIPVHFVSATFPSIPDSRSPMHDETSAFMGEWNPPFAIPTNLNWHHYPIASALCFDSDLIFSANDTLATAVDQPWSTGAGTFADLNCYPTETQAYVSESLDDDHRQFSASEYWRPSDAAFGDTAP